MNELFLAKSISPFPIKGMQMEHDIVLYREGINKAAWDDGTTMQFELTKEMAQAAINKFNSHGSMLPVDFDHATEYVERGETPSAVGRIKRLSWKAGVGLVATLLLYEKAIKALENGEVIYHSPAARFLKEETDDGVTYTLDQITSVALVNHPATVSAIPIAASSKKENNKMSKQEELEVLATEGVAPDAVEGEPLAPEDAQDIEETNSALDELTSVLEGMGVEIPEDATADDVIMLAVAALQPEEAPAEEVEESKETIAASASVPVGYISVDEYNEVTQKYNALLAEKEKAEAEALIAGYVKENKLNQFDEKQMAWAKSACLKDKEGFTLLMGSAPAIVKPGQVTLKGDTKSGTTDREVIIMAACKAHKEERDSGSHVGSLKGYVNGQLRASGEQTMNADEEKKYLV